MKNKGIKFIFSAIVIISCIVLIAGFINKKNNEVISETLKKSTYAIEKSIQNNELTEEVINKDNSEYEVDDDGKLELVEYIGNEDSVIIPLEINEHRVEKINTQAFVDNQELEMIKIPVELENVVDEIEKFEVNNNLSNDEYIVYSTIREYADEYIDYINSSDEEKNSYDFIPTKFKIPIEQLYSSAIQEVYGDVDSLSDTLPSSYDLRNHISIGVENQENFGICYAYSTLTSVETNLALKKNINKDFSEMHAAVVSRLGSGGTLYELYYKYFEKAYGPVLESQWSKEMIKEQRNLGQPFFTKIYDFCIDDTSLTEAELDDTVSGMLVTEPQNYVISAYSLGVINGYDKKNPQREPEVQKNRNILKQHIMNYGAIQAGIADPNNSNICQYYNGRYVMNTQDDSLPENHGVNIIGWDDNFSASNFPSSLGVTQNGAFLVLNTWGESWGNNGCFWVSYQDFYIESGGYAVLEVSDGKVDVNNGTLTLDKNTYEYNGTAREPIVEFSYFTDAGLGGDKKKNTDYTVSYSNNINAGTATVTIKGMGRYTGTATKTFTIQPKNISGFTVTLSQENYTYDGTAKTPTVTVKDGDKTLTNGSDYTVAYTNNINGGTATATITGIGNYSGTQAKNFTITGKNISETTITLSADTVTYDGTAKTPTVTVKDGNTTLTNGTDYTVAYTNNTNVGTATVTVTGKGTYLGTKTKNFTITAKSITGTTITLSVDTFTYDGTAKTPTVTVKDGSKTLTNGTDYSIAFSNNINVGTATVTVTGKGNYSGTLTKNYTITAKNANELTVAVDPQTFEYDGNSKIPNVTVKDGSKTLTNGTDYSIAFSNNINVGTATVTVTGKGNYTGIITKNYTITAKSISGAILTLSADTFIYDGTAKMPTVTVKYGDKTLTNGTDYTVSYTNNINVGTATATVTGKGNYGGTNVKNFTIKGMEIVSTTTGYNDIYDGNNHGILVNVTNPSTGANIKYGTSEGNYTLNQSPEYKDVGIYKVYYQITANNYETKTGYATIEIKEKNISNATITLDVNAYVYDGTAKEPTPMVKVGDKTIVKDTDYTVTYTNNVNVGTATVTVTGINNYNGSLSKDYTISNANMEAEVSGYEDIYDSQEHGITITVNNPSSGFTIKYGTSEVDISLDEMPKYSDVGTYKIYYKIIADNYNEINGFNTVKITEKSIENSNINIITDDEEFYMYDKNSKEPEIMVMDGNKTLIKDVDYEIEYKDNINAGTGKIIVKGKGNYNNNKTETFEIVKGNPDFVIPSGIITAEGRTLRDVKLPDNFEWEQDLDTLVGEVGYITFSCKYIPEDLDNYNIVTGIEVSLTVMEKIEVEFENYTPELVENEEDKVIYLKNIQPRTSIKDFEEKIKTNGTLKIYNIDEIEVSSKNQIIKTGMKIKIQTDAENIEYILIVTGDVNGDGKFNSMDLLRLARYIDGIEPNLGQEYIHAGNIVADTKIDKKDCLKMARIMANMEE